MNKLIKRLKTRDLLKLVWISFSKTMGCTEKFVRTFSGVKNERLQKLLENYLWEFAYLKITGSAGIWIQTDFWCLYVPKYRLATRFYMELYNVQLMGMSVFHKYLSLLDHGFSYEIIY